MGVKRKNNAFLYKMKIRHRAKVMCTIGQASSSQSTIKKLIEEGMDAANYIPIKGMG